MLSNTNFRHENIRILGFTKEVSKLMDVADVLVTKPGGMTCTEGMSKGIPMLFYEPIPGQEEENCEYFIRNGFGEMLEKTETVDKWMATIQQIDESSRYRQTLLDKRNEQYNPTTCPKAVLRLLQ